MPRSVLVVLGLAAAATAPLARAFRPSPVVGPIRRPSPRQHQHATAQFDQDTIRPRSPDPESLPLPPGPFRWPLAGNMLEVFRKGSVHHFERRVFEKYGPVVRAHLLGRPWYIISDPQLAQEILVTRREEFPDRFVFPQVTDLVGIRGIFFANGPEPERNRRMSLPAFHRTDILNPACFLASGLARKLAGRYARQLRAGGAAADADGGLVVDFIDDMKRLTLEAVSQNTFSLSFGLLDDEDGEGRASSKTRTQDGELAIDGRRMDTLLRNHFFYLAKASRFLIPGAHRVGLNPAFRKFKKINAELSAAEDAIIAQRRSARAAARSNGEPVPPAKDLLDVYLEALEEEGIFDDDGKDASGEEGFSNASLRATMNDAFLAGSDTTASTMAAAIFEIARDPELKARVQAEIAAAALDPNNPADWTPAGLTQKLPLLDRCLKETYRLYPIASTVWRIARATTELGGFRIPAGVVVAPSVLNYQTDPRLWGPDAREFRPERWEVLDKATGNLPRGVPAGSYTPFGAGPRICIGMRFAYTVTIAVAATLFSPGMSGLDLGPIAPDQHLEPYYPATLNFVGGVPMRVREAAAAAATA